MRNIKAGEEILEWYNENINWDIYINNKT
jgi:hypothetical protein